MMVIRLEGMHFHAYHGVHKEEKENGNDFVVDIKVHARLSAIENDDIEETIDYEVIYTRVADIMNQPSVDLLETLCNKIGSSLLETFTSIQSVLVTVKKLNPPVGGKTDLAAVEMEFGV